jgi:hypothetical protein
MICRYTSNPFTITARWPVSRINLLKYPLHLIQCRQATSHIAEALAAQITVYNYDCKIWSFALREILKNGV